MSPKFLNDQELMMLEPDLERLNRAYHLLSKDTNIALIELEQLSKIGSTISMLYLGDFYYSRKYGNFEKAKFWFRRAYSNNSIGALLKLAGIYYKRKEYDEAEKIYRDGVLFGDPASMYWLATIYLTKRNGDEKKSEAIELLEKSMMLGNIAAKHGLGLILISGKFGIKKDLLRGIRLLIFGAIDAFIISFRDPSNPRLG